MILRGIGRGPHWSPCQSPPKFTYENDAFLGVWAFIAIGKIEILASYPRQHCSQYLRVLPEILEHFGRDLGGVPTGVRVGQPLNPPMETMILGLWWI